MRNSGKAYRAHPVIKRLIIITGLHRVVRDAIRECIGDLPDIEFFPAIESNLGQKTILPGGEISSIFDESVMRKEFERDKAILAALEVKSCVIVEQWHIGNLALARLGSPSDSEMYLTRLRRQLQHFEGIQLDEFYVSTDIESSGDEHRSYIVWLEKLGEITKELNIPCETVDGSAPSKFLKLRVRYLLENRVSNVRS